MSKKLHPVRRLLAGLYDAGMAPPFDPADLEPVVARHVKPLLDALEWNHNFYHGDWSHHKREACDHCRLLAEWRAKL